MTRTINFPTLYRQTAEGFYILAHRGASYYCPENTMPAFNKAFEMGADLIELDITLSKDKIPVVFHDTKLDIKTDVNGDVRSFTLKELKKIDAGSWFGNEFIGTTIPTLEEVLQWATGKISLNIEIKPEASTNSNRPGVEDIAVELVRIYGMEKHIIFSSFSYSCIEKFKKIAPEIPAGLLYDRKSPGYTSPADLVDKYDADSFNCHWRELKRGWRQELQKQGIPIFIYTVNSALWMRRLIRQGISGIFTDRPDLLRSVVLDLFETLPEKK